MTTTYVTVAIPYVNAAPHLGYAYELVQADIWARARRAAGDRVRFLGGTDDYSLKNVLAAEAAGVPVREFVDSHAERFEALAGWLDLSFDDFIRTSADPRHRPAVERLWRACATRGDLYRRSYQGDYCLGCEQFYAPDDLVDGRCPEHGRPTERVAEDNWFFRLSRYQDHIESLLSSGRLQVDPPPFRDEVLAFVRGGLDDISVSRSSARARGWGIPVPGDPDQVIYVWFDALTNYISALGFGQAPAGAAAGGEGSDYRRWWLGSDHRVHVIGKGILRFHAVYWPAFLASAGEPPPTRIQVHPYLTAGGAKLSKSAGNAVGPEDVVAAHGADALRWWFAREVSEVADTDFTTARLVAAANEDLANGLGNVTNRIVTLVHRTRGGTVPSPDGRGTGPVVPGRDAPAGRAGQGPDGADGLQERVLEALGAFEHRRAARLIAEAVGALNRDIETTRPWELARAARRGDAGAGARLDAVLARQVDGARAVARAAAPIVPELSARLLEQLGPGRHLPPPRPAFARLAPA